jgi:hypothetical protein
MKTLEIQSGRWQEFCEKFTEFNRGSLLTIEIIGRDGIRAEVFRDVPLDKMTFDKTDACNDVINVGLNGGPDQRKLNHIVIDPMHLRIRQAEAGKKLLEIGSENGTTLMTFHSGHFPQREDYEENRTVVRL